MVPLNRWTDNGRPRSRAKVEPIRRQGLFPAAHGSRECD
jgi:hypothetical protein